MTNDKPPTVKELTAAVEREIRAREEQIKGCQATIALVRIEIAGCRAEIRRLRLCIPRKPRTR